MKCILTNISFIYLVIFYILCGYSTRVLKITRLASTCVTRHSYTKWHSSHVCGGQTMEEVTLITIMLMDFLTYVCLPTYQCSSRARCFLKLDSFNCI